jgi:ankyrin repeat protein
MNRNLLKAASEGNHSRVVQLLDSRANPNYAQSPENITPLLMAAQQGSLEVVQELLQRGAHPDARTSQGLTPLYMAALHGHMDVAAALMERLVAVDVADDNGFTPLHAAAFKGHLAMLEVLMEAGCGVNAASSTGITPLHHASRQGQQWAVSLLLERGAAVGAACGEGLTPLHWASSKGHLEVVAVLLRANASLTAVTNKGQTPLLLASSNGHEQVVRLLLSKGADPFTPDETGSLPLHVACRGNHTQTAVRLLDGRQTPAHVNAADGDHYTPLHLASSMGYRYLVAMLLKAGADVDARTDTQRTPLHLAIGKGHLLVLKQLLAAGADPAALFQDGGPGNGLHVAAMHGRDAALEVLLPAITAAAGRSVVDAEYQGLTPLHWAVEQGHTWCAEALLRAGADPDTLYGAGARSPDGASSLAGASVLHRAVQLGERTLVRRLATPANMSSCWEGQTPLHCALRLGVAGLEMVWALMHARSPAGVVGADGTTAMSLAGSSSEAAIRGQLPGMVRKECQRIKAMQQAQAGPQQQQQQGQGQQEAAAVLAAVVEGVSCLVRATAATGGRPGTVASCFHTVMGVLGPAQGGGLLQQVLGRVRGTPTAGHPNTVTLFLYRLLHGEWMAEVKPLLEHRFRVTHRFQRLVTQPPQPQPQRTWQMGAAGWVAAQATEAKEQALAAAGAGEWPLFVRLLEQVAALRPASATFVLNQVAQAMVVEGVPSCMGLCEALLAAWVAARQGLASRMQRERADVVLEFGWCCGPTTLPAHHT